MGVCTPLGHWGALSGTGSYWEAGARVMPRHHRLHLPRKPSTGCPPVLQRGGVGSHSSATILLPQRRESPSPAGGERTSWASLRGLGRINEFSGRIRAARRRVLRVCHTSASSQFLCGSAPVSPGARWPWPRLGWDAAQTCPAAPRVTPVAEPSPPLRPGQWGCCCACWGPL